MNKLEKCELFSRKKILKKTVYLVDIVGKKRYYNSVVIKGSLDEKNKIITSDK